MMMIDVSGERCGNLKFAFYSGFGIDWEAPRYDGIIGISWTSTSLKSLFRHQLGSLMFCQPIMSKDGLLNQT